MPGPGPGIHVFLFFVKTWMAGTTPGHDVEGASIPTRAGIRCYLEASGNAQAERQWLDRMEMLVVNCNSRRLAFQQPRLVKVSDLVGLGVEQIEGVELDANAVVEVIAEPRIDQCG